MHLAKKLELVLFCLVFLILISAFSYATTNISILHGWNGTEFVPIHVDASGRLKTTLNLSESTGITPDADNSRNLGSLALRWSNGYFVNLIATGNVGIGATTPGKKLEVAGTINATGLNITGTSENATFMGDVQIMGTLYGGSPLKVSGGINVTSVVSGQDAFFVTDASNEKVLRITDTGELNITSSAGNTSFDSGTLFIDAENNFVGIGTSSPAEKLVVIGSVNISDSLNVSGTIQATTFIGDGSLLSGIDTSFTNNTDINVTNFVANNTLFVSRSMVGIGIVSPQKELHVIGSANVTGTVYAHNFSGNSNISFLNASGDEVMRITDSGRVGIGNSSPAAILEIGGGIKIANDADSCDSTKAGTIRWTGGDFEGCNGVSWVALTSDAMPTSFAFTNQTGVPLSTLNESDILQITGINVNSIVSVSGNGTPAYRICANADCSSVTHNWSTSAGSIDNNEYLQIRLTSSASGSTANSVSIIVGAGSGVWNVTTGQEFMTATGGSITTDGDYKIHSFTSGGTFTVTGVGVDATYGDKVEYLVVGGGGGGGKTYGSGGGAGGLLYSASYAVTKQAYSITVGDGGAGSTSDTANGVNGDDSVFDSNTATGGGGGGRSSREGSAGGCGGGGGVPGGGVGSIGYDGGTGYQSGNYNQAGGGGMGAVGVSPPNDAGDSGDGGVGLEYSQFSAVGGSPGGWFSGGGGGGGASDGPADPGAGGTGGGGAGGVQPGNDGVAGTANTGGGGGGGAGSISDSGGAGGSGIVIIRYKFQ